MNCKSAGIQGSRWIFSAALAGVCASSAIAADGNLLIGGPRGEVWRGTFENNDFTYFTCTCNGPIQDLQTDDKKEFLFVGDEWGQVVRFRMSDGVPDRFMFASDPVTAIVTHNGDVLASAIDGTIRRLNGESGIIETTYNAPIQIDAMHRIGNTLYVSGPNAEVYKADLDGDMNFAYFACGCSGPVTSMTATDTHLLVGDTTGLLSGYRLSDGILDMLHFVGAGTVAALEAYDDDVLASVNGDLLRLDLQTGNIEKEQNPAIEVNAMLMLDAQGNANPLGLSIDNLVGGQRATMTVDGGTPGERVAVMWSESAGTYELNNGTWCVSFGLDLPANEIRRHTASTGAFDGNGNFRSSRVVPDSFNGHSILFQAAERNSCPDARMSDVIEAVVR